ncbi:MAG: DUF3179 domain-containing protein [Flavobacteriales bacterium]|nr:DUF3179 domain-containing protein [Flavobacteriales bacterium]
MRYSILVISCLMWLNTWAQENSLNINSNWKTDTNNVHSSVESLNEFKALIPRDVIPPIDNPNFWSKKQALDSLFGHEPVIAIEINGEAKGYPLSILMYHEIVNDIVGGVPVTGSYCPLCNAGIVFDRRLKFDDNEYELDFGVSGMLRNSDMVMWDRQTETWWQQFTGEGLVGKLQGALLTQIPSITISVEDFLLHTLKVSFFQQKQETR